MLEQEKTMRVLIIAPHPDDEVLGCGGIIAKNVSEGNEVYVGIVTKMCEPIFADELDVQNKEHCLNAHKLLGVRKTVFLDHPAAMLESVPRHVFNSSIGRLISDLQPDEVYIPHRGDLHLDHKMVADACMVALRPRFDYSVKRVYAYETLSETEWDTPNTVNVFMPNVFVDISDFIDVKIAAMKEYKNQVCEFPNPRSAEAIRALAMLRGSTISRNYAEAFMLIREIR